MIRLSLPLLTAVVALVVTFLAGMAASALLALVWARRQARRG